MNLSNLHRAIVTLATLVMLGAGSAYADDAINTAESYDSYAKATGVATDKFKVPDVGSFFSPAFAFASLRGGVTDVGTESMELLVYYHDANGWKFFSSALDSDGNTLPVQVLDRQVEDTIGINEQFEASLTRPYLEAHRISGLDIRFGGKYGLLTVKLPASYIQAFLARLETVEAAVREKLATKGKPNASPVSEKPKLGVRYVPVDATFARVAAMEAPQGVFLARVDSDSLAARSGLKVGDAILAIDGIPVPNAMTGFQETIANLKPGSRVSLTIWRGGREIMVPIQF